MNILFFTNTEGMYGANQSLIDMVEELKNKGVKICVVIMKDGDLARALRKCGIKTYIVPYNTSASPKGTLTFREKVKSLIHNIRCMPQIKTIIDKNNIDLIHSNASNIDIGGMAALWFHIPHVWHVRELLYEDYRLEYNFSVLSKFLLYKANIVIAISQYVMQGRKLGKNSVLLYNGFNIDKYKIVKTKLFPNQKLHILFCGMISKQKGIMDIIKAIGYLIREGYGEIELSIVGHGNPVYWSEISRYIENHNLTPYVRYYGYQSDMRIFREQADIAVMCSRCEALGRVTIESMLGQVLVIGADCGATKELIRDGETGYLYEPGNIRQLAQVIMSVQNDRKRCEQIIKNAQVYAERSFNREIYVKKLLQIYEQCILT